MDVKATLETRTSKSGNLYECVLIHITDSITTQVFLKPAELELLKQNLKSSKPENDNFDFLK